MSFLESPRFPDSISYGSSGGPMFKTNVIETYSGHEERNSDWTYPRFVYDVKEGVKDIDDMYAIYEHFMAVGGRLNGFRFKDWLDYKSTAIPTNTIATSDQVLGTGTSTTVEFALNKVYTRGTLSFTRRIYKPVANTVVVATDGSALVEGASAGASATSDYYVNTVSGLVTFHSAPVSGAALTCGYEFDVPVRFNDDSFNAAHDAYNIMDTSVFVIELRAPA